MNAAPSKLLSSIYGNNFLASVFFGTKVGVSFLDISTGEFLISEGSLNYVRKLINSFSPSEIIFPKSQKNDINSKIMRSRYSFSLSLR